MFDFIQKLTAFLLGIQNTLLPANSYETSASYSNNSSKKIYMNSASLELTTKTQDKKLKIEEEVKEIVNKYHNNPNKLIAFVRKNGTKVYKIYSADKILKLVGLEQGLITKTKGLKALFLNLLTSITAKEQINFSLSTEPMFVLDTKRLDAYSIIQQFHKWYSMKLKLPGFEESAQSKFQKIMTNKDIEVKDLNIKEILELKEAIARDAEAIDFVIKLAKSTEGSKSALTKISLNGASV